MGTASPLESAQWSMRLFGGLELAELPSGDRITSLGKRERVLLAYLAVSPNCRETRRKLATLLWGDASDETSLDNLRTCVWGLRKTLRDSAHRIIASEGEQIVLDASALDIDALMFRRLATEPDVQKLDEAAQLYAGEFLGGIDIDNEEFENWRRAQASQFREAAIDVLSGLTAQLANEGDTDRAIKAGLKLLQLDPLHEPGTRELMRLYAASGRRGAAMQLYRSLSEALKSELDAQPEAETRALYAEITRGDESQPPLERALKSCSGSGTGGEDVSGAPQPTAGTRPAITRPIGLTASESPNVLRFPLPAIVAALIVILLMVFSYRQFPLFRAADTVSAERTSASSQASAISIAVLPFTNMSGDKEQDFFSDGMTEEITTALAKVPDLRVVARQSAYQFKGENKDMRAVGKALGATHLIEGSVRKDGNRVRITAQVIRTADGTHVWANAYDRELKDIFVVQEDIAQAITTSLRMPLGLKQGEQLVSNRGIDSESYEKYLRAKALIRDRLGDNAQQALGQAAMLLEEVVARNANYAPGWASLAYAYDYTPTPNNVLYADGAIETLRASTAATLAKSDAAVERAIMLDPALPQAWLARALGQSVRGRYLAAEDFYLKALALDPYDHDALNSYGYMLMAVGHLRKAVPVRQKLESLEPLIPNYAVGTAQALWLSGDEKGAVSVLQGFPNVPLAQRLMARIHAADGRFKAAADALHLTASETSPPAKQDQAAARLLRNAQKKLTAVGDLPDLGAMSFVFHYIGADQRILDFHERSAERGFSLGANTALLWESAYASIRKTKRFRQLVRKQGLYEYWRARGWPDMCHPTTGDDFECS